MPRPNDPVPAPGRTWPWLAALLGLACYLNTLPNGYVYDDVPIVRDNARIRSLDGLGRIWLTDWWSPQNPDQEAAWRHRDRLYRPLTLTTFALNRELAGDNPAAFHAVNALLHALVCALAGFFVRRLFSDPPVAAVSALLFAVHPVHVEAVAYLVGRAELLATLFLLLGLLVLFPVGRPARPWRGPVAAGLFLAALFSKETAVCYLPTAWLLLWVFKDRAGAEVNNRRLAMLAWLLLPLVVYLPLRYVALDGHLLRDRPPHGLLNPLVWADPPHRLLHAITVFGHYLRLWLVPGRLSACYGYAVIDPRSGPGPMTAVGGLGCVLAATALVGFRRPKGSFWWQLALLTALFLAGYALISNTVLLIGVSVAERLAYWPSLPVLAAVAAAVVHFRRRWVKTSGRAWTLVGVVLLAALAVRTVVRNQDWRSNLTLFARDAQTYPGCAVLRVGYAEELLRLAAAAAEPGEADARSWLEEADRHLAAALEIYPQYGEAARLRGQVLALLGDREGALACLETAVRLSPFDRLAQQWLASLRDQTGERASRRAELADQVATRPADPVLRLAYGQRLLVDGYYHEALEELQTAVELDPDSGDAWRCLGEAYAATNHRQAALEALRAAVERKPDDWRIHKNLSALLLGQDDQAALHHARRAWELAPQIADTQLALAESLAAVGQTREALRWYRNVEESLPPNDPMRAALRARIEALSRAAP